MARERETGLWRVIAVSGLSPIRLLILKAASLAELSLLALSPLIVAAFAAPALSAAPVAEDQVQRVLSLVTAYGLYLSAWIAVTLVISAFLPSSRAAIAVRRRILAAAQVGDCDLIDRGADTKPA